MAGRARSRSRGEPADRLESEHSGFFAQIEAAYADLQRAEPERIRRIDAAQAPEAVLADSLTALSDLL
jgi:dTMP kinase